MTVFHIGAVSAELGHVVGGVMAGGTVNRLADGGLSWLDSAGTLLPDHDDFVFHRPGADTPAPREGLTAALAWAGGDDSAGALGRAAAALTNAHDAGATAQASLFAGPAFDGTGLEEARIASDVVLLTSYTSGKGGLGVTSDYNITVNFDGTWTPELQQRFILAAEYLSSLITGDVKDRGGIDDIVIDATLSDIDGVNGVLGQAGPSNFRLKGWLPTKGIMEFDIADAETFDSQGLFDDIVIHEMLHTLGFGTIWNFLGLTTGSIKGDDMLFTGKNAKIALKALFPDVWDDLPRRHKGVPVETDGGSGTAGGHWDNDTFGNELMTGYIDDDNWVSGMTVAALEDMGYDTVFNSSNPSAPILQPDDLFA